VTSVPSVVKKWIMTNRINPHDIKKILIIQYGPIGDGILNQAVFANIRREFPHMKTCYLVDYQPWTILKDRPEIDEFLIYKRSSKKGLVNYLKYLLYDLSIILQVRRKKFDCIIDLIGKPKSFWVTLFSGVKYRIGRRTRGRTIAYNYFYQPSADKYTVDQRLASLELFGLKNRDSMHRISYPEEEREFARKFLDSKAIKKEDMKVVISPNQDNPSRQWLPESFTRLADLIIRKYGAKIIFVWGPGEYDHTLKIRNAMEFHEKAFLIPPTSVAQMTAIIGMSSLVIANCSGPKHIAVGLGLPVITIAGPTNSNVWNNPLNPLNQSLQAWEVSCVPCEKNICPREKHYCMEAITPGMVMKVIEQIKSEV
jgi:ADP-heptose:LPS heptosyltransferase